MQKKAVGGMLDRLFFCKFALTRFRRIKHIRHEIG